MNGAGIRAKSLRNNMLRLHFRWSTAQGEEKGLSGARVHSISGFVDCSKDWRERAVAIVTHSSLAGRKNSLRRLDKRPQSRKPR